MCNTCGQKYNKNKKTSTKQDGSICPNHEIYGQTIFIQGRGGQLYIGVLTMTYYKFGQIFYKYYNDLQFYTNVKFYT